jgi:hypothetical protein
MKSDSLAKHAFAAFGIALVLYVICYAGDRHLRLRKGPWQVTFQSDSNATPSIIVNEPVLNIQRLQITFPGEHATAANLSTNISFDHPAIKPPFGDWIYDDLMYLPGTVTLNLFGHEIELLPRVLGIDRREFKWQSDAIIRVSTNKPPLPGPKPRL